MKKIDRYDKLQKISKLSYEKNKNLISNLLDQTRLGIIIYKKYYIINQYMQQNESELCFGWLLIGYLLFKVEISKPWWFLYDVILCVCNYCVKFPYFYNICIIFFFDWTVGFWILNDVIIYLYIKLFIFRVISLFLY